VRIWSRTGRRPLGAGGNSDGDVPMLPFARTRERDGRRLLLLYDDADREFAYTAGAEEALERAEAQGWTVASIKDDWATVLRQHLSPAVRPLPDRQGIGSARLSGA
jgi:hypothetical protein